MAKSGLTESEVSEHHAGRIHADVNPDVQGGTPMTTQPVHFALEVTDRLATLDFNRRDRRGTRFDLDMLAELEVAIASLTRLTEIDTILIRGNWNVDLDLDEVIAGEALTSPRNLAVRGQQLLQQLEKLGERFHTVAWIEGECAGIGLEVALACRTRIGLQLPGNSIRFDFAEKSLLPSWGGVQRLNALLGASRSRALLTHSTNLSLVEAEHLGMVQHVFAMDTPDSRILDWLEESRRKPGESTLFRFWKKLGRAALNVRTRSDAIPANDEYLEVMHGVLAASRISTSEGLTAERNAFSTLSERPACRQAARLRRIAERRSEIGIAPPHSIGVVGESREAIELALFFAKRGLEVVLHPGSTERESRLTTRLQESMRTWLRRGYCSEAGSERLLEQIHIVERWEAFSEVGWLLEGTRKEGFDLCETYARLGEVLPRRAILSPVHSRIALAELQSGFPSPERMLGLDCIESFRTSRVIELLPGTETDESLAGFVADWFARWDKATITLPVGSSSVLRRLLTVYFSEAIHLVAEGMPPERIDREIRRRGMPRGPLESIDRIGFDEVASWVRTLEGNTEVANVRLERLRSLGWNGKSGGEGFYRYRKGRKWENEIARMVLWRSQEDDCTQQYTFDADQAMATGIDRILLRVANEAGRMLEEGIEIDQIDLGTAWGLRLLPHEGGILSYADTRGLPSIQDRLVEYCDRFGKRFEPCEELQRRVDAGEPLLSENRFAPVRRVRRAG